LAFWGACEARGRAAKQPLLPKDYTLNTDIFGFTIKYSQQGNRVIASQELRKNYLLLQPQDFSSWNSSLRQLNSQYKEQVVLEMKRP